MRISIELPRVGRRRLIGTSALCATASTLWIGAPLWVSGLPLLPDADTSGLLVLSGLTFPAAVGWVTLLLMERRILRDLDRAERQAEAEREAVTAR